MTFRFSVGGGGRPRGALVAGLLVALVAGRALPAPAQEAPAPPPGGADPVITDEAEPDEPDRREGPAEQAERSEVRTQLEASIRALPDTFRAVFMLRAVQGLSVEETARALGLSQATVKTRLFRARHRLRTAMPGA